MRKVCNMAIDAVRFTENSIRGRPGRGNHGRADQRTPGKRGLRRVCCWTYRRKPRARGSSARESSNPILFSRPMASIASRRAASTRICNVSQSLTGSSKRSSNSQTRNARCWNASTRCAGLVRSSVPTHLDCPSQDCRKAEATISGVTGSARTFSTHLDISRYWNSFRRRKPTRQYLQPFVISPIAVWGKTPSWLKIRRGSSPTTWPCTALCGFSKRLPRDTTRLKRSMR